MDAVGRHPAYPAPHLVQLFAASRLWPRRPRLARPWQDSLALLLHDPAAVRGDLVRYFAGVRADGTNATIIGRKPGEFVADRNRIVRVWMDHGYWPLVTTRSVHSADRRYFDFAGKSALFCDDRKCRGEHLNDTRPAAERHGAGAFDCTKCDGISGCGAAWMHPPARG